MDFKDQIKQLGERVNKLKDNILTEEATKNAFIMPFLQTLGYDVFDPLEVVPEFVADLGIKKGEKIDYAIFKDGNPTILIECKHWAQNLNVHDGQLMRYFHVSKARFGILTNGIIYRFYSDLVEANKMDEKPFFEINISDTKENQIEELKKFHKSYFNIESIVTTASELKYMNELKTLIINEFNTPSENFVKLFTKQVYPGVITAKVLDQFTGLTKRTLQQFISESITERLKSALDRETTVIEEKAAEENDVQISEKPKIETTQDELEAFYVIKAILRSKIEGSRITYRDAQSYFAILLDDNNRKTICRIYLNTKKKQIGIFDSNKVEIKNEINSIDQIYDFSDSIIAVVESYLN